jgi:hypothetical protein
MKYELENYNLIPNIINKSSKIHAVLEANTGRFICLSNHLETVTNMMDHNTKLWTNINTNHKLPLDCNPNLPHGFVFKLNTGVITRRNVRNNQEMYRLVILSEKAACLDMLYKMTDAEFEQMGAENGNWKSNSFTNSRKEEIERFKYRFTKQIKECASLIEVNDTYNKLIKESYLYANF